MLIVYTKPECSTCKALKQLLDELGIPYLERDFDDTDTQAQMHMNNIVLTTVPSLQIGGLVFECKGELDNE